MQIPDVQYARSGDVSIAYRVVWEGPIDLVFLPRHHRRPALDWDQPLLVRHVEGLGARSDLERPRGSRMAILFAATC